MLVEHTFVTTLDEAATVQRAQEVLTGLGFASSSSDGQAGPAYQRGLKNPARARRVDHLPQRAVLTFDRGRVCFAASTEEARRLRKDDELQKRMLLSLARLLERCVGGLEDLELVRADWDDLHARIGEHHRRRSSWNRVITVILLGVILVSVGTCFLAASR
jgi:hypothetical protein